jgi:hypothetical protein
VVVGTNEGYDKKLMMGFLDRAELGGCNHGRYR